MSKKPQLMIRLSPEMMEGLKRRAGYYERSVTVLVRDCIDAGLPAVLKRYERERREADDRAAAFAAWDGPAAEGGDDWPGVEDPTPAVPEEDATGTAAEGDGAGDGR